ncbi:hypothetical protein GMOD_00004126 [Pyrenophora seminiperda CCB06]|uniref:Uncharacterized protein n=1 Tax=Pyrenophora seminiperda CCB06 TaxID=1302712 RepID=A0A3M7M0T8_9PLEO|nr:hypothetical protein GMOD_00004126 [Pyrenophora seminiperda CCB06]
MFKRQKTSILEMNILIEFHDDTMWRSRIVVVVKNEANPHVPHAQGSHHTNSSSDWYRLMSQGLLSNIRPTHLVNISVANVVFNIPESTPDNTDMITSGVNVVEIRWPEHLVFSPPSTEKYGDLYLITKEDERMVARITEPKILVGLNESFTYTLPSSNESQTLMFCIIAASKPGTSIYNTTEPRALSRSFTASPLPSFSVPTTLNTTTSETQSSPSQAHIPIPTSYGYTKLPQGAIAGITLASLFLITLFVTALIIFCEKRKKKRANRKTTLIEIAGTPTQHKYFEMEANTELPARLTRQGF